MINRESLFKIAPGLLLCSAFAALIVGATSLLPKTGFDPLLIALVLGIAFKNIFPKAQWHSAGTKFSGKFILELSVMILGAGIFFPAVGSAGVGLFALIMFGVAGSMAIAFFVGHTLLKLGPRLSILIGVSNSICGNSAAAIIAPIIGASSVVIRYGKLTNFLPSLLLGKLFTMLFTIFFVSSLALESSSISLILIMGIFFVFVPMCLVTLAPRYIAAHEVQLFFVLETALGPIWVWYFINERPSDKTIVGGIFIILIIFIYTILESKDKKTS